MASKREEIFGELRSLLQQPPSHAIWAQLCVQLDKVKPDEYFEDAIAPYLLDALKTWPDDPTLRVAPPTWCAPALKQKPTPMTRFATGVNLSSSRCGPAGLKKLLAGDLLVGKTYLNLSHNGLKSDGAMDFAVSPKIDALRVLILVDCKIGERGAVALARCHRLANLETLDLSKNDFVDEGCGALESSKHLSESIRKLAWSWYSHEREARMYSSSWE